MNTRITELEKLIQEQIKKPLAEELLFGKLTEGGRVRVDVADGKLEFEIESGVVH